MDLTDSAEEAHFRAECRSWLEANAPRRSAGNGVPSLFRSASDDPAGLAAARAWQARKADGGWAGLTWPVAYGGRGAPAMHQVIFNQEIAAYDVAEIVFAIGQHMAGPTLIAHATPAQQQRWLPPLQRGEEIWCQLFSEPDAGSDLASLRTTAVAEGDDWVVNGQKVWSSGAHYSDWGMLLARTDPAAPKHAGITWFGLDMRTPGVTVKPLRQMNGRAHFNEVFFTDVRVGARHVVGDVHAGWTVAVTTLLSERLMAGDLLGADDLVEALVQLARARGRADDRVVRDGLARVAIAARTLRYLNYRMLTTISHSGMPGPEASVAKLATARLFADAGDLALSLLGPAGAACDSAWQAARLEAPALRLGGGTDEVLKNVIAERVLGLPRDPKPV
jgi:alkylation response protein AidB-like acyl-CoA dehydrogenase